MSSDSILLADTDHRLSTCRTVRQVCCRLERSTYTAVVMTPTFFHTPQILQCY